MDRHMGELGESLTVMALLRQESGFLSVESKNGIHEHADTQGSEWIGFTKEEESTRLSA